MPFTHPLGFDKLLKASPTGISCPRNLGLSSRNSCCVFLQICRKQVPGLSTVLWRPLEWPILVNYKSKKAVLPWLPMSTARIRSLNRTSWSFGRIRFVRVLSIDWLVSIGRVSCVVSAFFLVCAGNRRCVFSVLWVILLWRRGLGSCIPRA